MDERFTLGLYGCTKGDVYTFVHSSSSKDCPLDRGGRGTSLSIAAFFPYSSLLLSPARFSSQLRHVRLSLEAAGVLLGHLSCMGDVGGFARTSLAGERKGDREGERSRMSAKPPLLAMLCPHTTLSGERGGGGKDGDVV